MPDQSQHTYPVMVDDNYHYRDESYRYKLGNFPDCESATSACRKIVDSFLLDAYKPGMSAQELYKTYQGFGEDPFIYTTDRNCRFSAWKYAEQRCEQIAK